MYTFVLSWVHFFVICRDIITVYFICTTIFWNVWFLCIKLGFVWNLCILGLVTWYFTKSKKRAKFNLYIVINYNKKCFNLLLSSYIFFEDANLSYFFFSISCSVRKSASLRNRNLPPSWSCSRVQKNNYTLYQYCLSYWLDK